MSEFDKHWDTHCISSNCEEDEAKIHFEAGQQSQQAKIDSLNKNIEALHVEIGRIQKEYQGMFEGMQGGQKTINELQGRIDKAIVQINLYYDSNGMEDIVLSDISEILKGEK